VKTINHTRKKWTAANKYGFRIPRYPDKVARRCSSVSTRRKGADTGWLEIRRLSSTVVSVPWFPFQAGCSIPWKKIIMVMKMAPTNRWSTLGSGGFCSCGSIQRESKPVGPGELNTRGSKQEQPSAGGLSRSGSNGSSFRSRHLRWLWSSRSPLENRYLAYLACGSPRYETVLRETV
jgi:hypothetical protein